MKPNKTTSALASAALALALGGCGGSDYGSSAPPPVTPPVSMVDAFFRVVANLIRNSPEDSEPQSIDTVTVSAPDNTEPTPL